MNDIKVKLEDVCERGSSNLAQKDLENLTGDYPVYGASGYVKDIDFYHQKNEYVAVVKDGAGIGRTVFLPGKSSVIGTLQYLLPKDNIVPKYLYYAVASMKLEKYYTGATIPHIYFKDYKKEVLLLPNKNMQLEIVSILEKAEKIIGFRKQQLEALDNLVKSRFVEMFGDPVSNSFEWRIECLSDVGTLGRGVSKHRPRNAPELLGGIYPLIQTGDVANAGLYITDYKSTYSDLGLSQSKMWEKGTLCITIAANIAKTSILNFDSCFPDSIVGFIPNINTNNIFMHYWFGFFQQLLESQAPESAQKNINLQILSELKVIVPPIDLQKQFTTFVQKVDKLKVVVKKSIDETKLLFDSLMQKYFG